MVSACPCFVDAGDKLDVSGNDLLQYFEVDEASDVIGLYLESFGNPRRFTRIVRRVARVKPVVVVKAGRWGIPRRTESHTAALATPAFVADAVLRESGVTRVDSLDQLFDLAAAFATQPLPRGRRVAIVGTFRGPATLAADAAEAAGLQIVEMREVALDATPAVLAGAVRAALANERIDAALVVHPSGPSASAEQLLAALDALATDAPDDATAAKPILASLLGPSGRGPLERGDVPVYRAPESAARGAGGDGRSRRFGSLGPPARCARGNRASSTPPTRSSPVTSPAARSVAG